MRAPSTFLQRLSLILAGTSAVLCAESANAVTRVWASNVASTNWSAAASWTGGVVPGSDDTASVPKGGARPYVVPGETNDVGGVVLYCKDSSLCHVNGTGTLRLGAVGLTITVESGSGGTSGALKPELLLDANQSWTLGGGSTAVFTFDGRIGESNGPRSLVVGGGGSMVLNSGDSDFAGGFSRTAGGLRLGASSALDANGDVLKSPVGKGTLTLSNMTISDSNGRTLRNSLVIAGNLVFGRSGQSTYVISFAPSTGTTPTSALLSAVVNGTQHTITLFNDRQNPTISQAIGETGATGLGLIVTNGTGSGSTTTGVMTLSGTSANTFTGTTSVRGATLKLSKSANIVALAGNVELRGGKLHVAASEQIADASTLRIVTAGAPLLQLDTSVAETIGELWVDDVRQADGTYTSITSTFITGSGGLIVKSPINPATVILIK